MKGMIENDILPALVYLYDIRVNGELTMTVLKPNDAKPAVPGSGVNLSESPVAKETIPTAEQIQTDLKELAEGLRAFPANPDWPIDGAKQIDHYLYGLPKRP